jgi:hypothetical protein
MRYFTKWFVLLHGVGGAVMLEAEVAAQTHRAPEGNLGGPRATVPDKVHTVFISICLAQ